MSETTFQEVHASQGIPLQQEGASYRENPLLEQVRQDSANPESSRADRLTFTRLALLPRTLMEIHKAGIDGTVRKKLHERGETRSSEFYRRILIDAYHVPHVRKILMDEIKETTNLEALSIVEGSSQSREHEKPLFAKSRFIVVGAGPTGSALALNLPPNDTLLLDLRDERGGQFGIDRPDFPLDYAAKNIKGAFVQPRELMESGPMMNRHLADALKISTFLKGLAVVRTEVKSYHKPNTKSAACDLEVVYHYPNGEQRKGTMQAEESVVVALGIGRPTYGGLDMSDRANKEAIASGQVFNAETFPVLLAQQIKESHGRAVVEGVRKMVENDLSFVGGGRSMSAALDVCIQAIQALPTYELEDLLRKHPIRIFDASGALRQGFSHSLSGYPRIARWIQEGKVKILRARVSDLEMKKNRVLITTGQNDQGYRLQEWAGTVAFMSGYNASDAVESLKTLESGKPLHFDYVDNVGPGFSSTKRVRGTNVYLLGASSNLDLDAKHPQQPFGAVDDMTYSVELAEYMKREFHILDDSELQVA